MEKFRPRPAGPRPTDAALRPPAAARRRPGIVNVLVGFAALKPAEFVVVKISQKAGQVS